LGYCGSSGAAWIDGAIMDRLWWRVMVVVLVIFLIAVKMMCQ
jgi:hypothetical protein